MVEDHLHFKRYLFPKGLPEEWEKVYRLTFKRLKRYYWKEKYVTNPIMAIILERIAYTQARLQYMESDDYTKNFPGLTEKLDFEKKHNSIQKDLLKSMEQLMKYTEVKVVPNRVNVKVQKKRIETSEDVQQLSDNELQRQIKGYLESTTVTVRGEAKETEPSQLDKGLHGEVSMDKGQER